METSKVKKSLGSLIVLALLNQVALDQEQMDHSFALEGVDASRDALLLIGKKSNLKMKAVKIKPDLWS